MIFGGIKRTRGFLNCLAQRFYLNWSLTLKTKSSWSNFAELHILQFFFEILIYWLLITVQDCLNWIKSDMNIYFFVTIISKPEWLRSNKLEPGEILAGSVAVKVSEPSRMSPRLLIGREGTYWGFISWQGKQICEDVPLWTNQRPRNMLHRDKYRQGQNELYSEVAVAKD